MGARGAVLALLAALLFAPATSHAVALYFTGSNTGFGPSAVSSAGLSPFYGAGPGDVWLSAGDPSFTPSIAVVETSRNTVNNPQQQLLTPSVANPALVDISIRITNTSTTNTLTAPLLVFTGANPGPNDPDVTQIGLEAGLLDKILCYDPDGADCLAPSGTELLLTGNELFYGVLELPSLAPGAFVDRVIRFAVAGTMDISNNAAQCAPDISPCVVVPPYGLAGLSGPTTVIPEPSTLLLLGAGLLLLRGARAA